ncbi:MAG: transcriptional regulator [Pirellulaceae bacterium]|nr:MAG: transcriptional regulator [Pirellulaceae bacterium]
MRLALHTDYALRTLMYLAVVGRQATAREVAEFYGISADHVAKVVNQLARRGYVQSVRGAGGGIRLSRAPEAISVGEVIEAMEGPLHLLDCVGSDGVCIIESYCKLRQVLREAERIQADYLRSVKLSDVLPGVRQLERTRSDSPRAAPRGRRPGKA